MLVTPRPGLDLPPPAHLGGKWPRGRSPPLLELLLVRRLRRSLRLLGALVAKLAGGNPLEAALMDC